MIVQWELARREEQGTSLLTLFNSLTMEALPFSYHAYEGYYDAIDSTTIPQSFESIELRESHPVISPS